MGWPNDRSGVLPMSKILNLSAHTSDEDLQHITNLLIFHFVEHVADSYNSMWRTPTGFVKVSLPRWCKCKWEPRYGCELSIAFRNFSRPLSFPAIQALLPSRDLRLLGNLSSMNHGLTAEQPQVSETWQTLY